MKFEQVKHVKDNEKNLRSKNNYKIKARKK